MFSTNLKYFFTEKFQAKLFLNEDIMISVRSLQCCEGDIFDPIKYICQIIYLFYLFIHSQVKRQLRNYLYPMLFIAAIATVALSYVYYTCQIIEIDSKDISK